MDVKNKLTGVEQACLVLIRHGNHLPNELFTAEVKDYLSSLELIELVDDGIWKLTEKGLYAVNTSVVLLYPMHNKGDVGSYDQVTKTMSDEAANALTCSIMNARMLERIPKKTMRVLGQHMLDLELYKQFGPELIRKWQVTMNKSDSFFKKMQKKHAKSKD